jgi:hypothetical protein
VEKVAPMSEWPWVAIFAGTALALYCGISVLVEWRWKRHQRQPLDNGFYDTERGDY